jgi:hypothetical protein
MATIHVSHVLHLLHTKALFRQFVQTLRAHFGHIYHRNHSSPSRSSESKPAQYKYLASASSSLSPLHLLVTLRKHLTSWRNGGFTSLLPVFTTDLIDLLFHWKGIIFCYFPFVSYCVSRKGLYDSLVSACVSRHHPSFLLQIRLL